MAEETNNKPPEPKVIFETAKPKVDESLPDAVVVEEDGKTVDPKATPKKEGK